MTTLYLISALIGGSIVGGIAGGIAAELRGVKTSGMWYEAVVYGSVGGGGAALIAYFMHHVAQ